jgi:hypothetical protein
MIDVREIWQPTDEHICGHEPVRIGHKVPFIPMTAPPVQDWREDFPEHRASQISELPIAIEKIADTEFRSLVRVAKEQMHDWLLRIGGWGVAMPGLDDDIACVIERGFLMPGSAAQVVAGTSTNCHGNAALWCAREPETVAMITGYALSPDGLWRGHSWIAHREEKEGGAPSLLESSKPRVAYFRFIRTRAEVMRLHDTFDDQEAVERLRGELRRIIVQRPGP